MSNFAKKVRGLSPPSSPGYYDMRAKSQRGIFILMISTYEYILYNQMNYFKKNTNIFVIRPVNMDVW